MVQRCGVHATIKSIILVRKTDLLPICHIFGDIRYRRHGGDEKRLQKVRNARRGAVASSRRRHPNRRNGLPAAPQGDLVSNHLRSIAGTESRGTTRTDAHRDPRANAPLVATLRAARLLHRLGDPVSRVGSYRSEIIIRLGLIEIARIKAKAVGRPQFPVENITYVKAATRAIPSGGVLIAHVGNCRRQQFGGDSRDGRRPAGSG
jgi:hypothetical protein